MTLCLVGMVMGPAQRGQRGDVHRAPAQATSRTNADTVTFTVIVIIVMSLCPAAIISLLTPGLGRQWVSSGPGLLTSRPLLPQAHTMYQVGLMETDQHIEFFWGALEMFAQEELCKFIKFACNQERIPFTCPCKDGGPDTAHVPPYPMKIAPPDGTAGTALPGHVPSGTHKPFSVWSWALPEGGTGKARGHTPPQPDLHRQVAVQARY